MKAAQRSAFTSTSRLSAGASLTIAALLGLYGTYRLVHSQPADSDFLIEIGTVSDVSSDPRDRPGKTERRTQAFNDDEKHQQYVKQIRDAEQADKVPLLPRPDLEHGLTAPLRALMSWFLGGIPACPCALGRRVSAVWI